MASKAEIIIEVAPDGSTEVRVEGFKGEGCEALTEAIERSLGKVASSRRTAEYREKQDPLRVKA